VRLTGAVQRDLVISRPDEPRIRADNLVVAQFISLLINSEDLSDVIETAPSKVVLILGRFSADGRATLYAIRDQLRQRGYLPV
jgi:hypothetical protein